MVCRGNDELGDDHVPLLAKNASFEQGVDIFAQGVVFAVVIMITNFPVGDEYNEVAEEQ